MCREANAGILAKPRSGAASATQAVEDDVEDSDDSASSDPDAAAKARWARVRGLAGPEASSSDGESSESISGDEAESDQVSTCLFSF